MDITGLYHMGAREMNPSMGIFVTADPSNAPDPEKPQTLSRYAYANNTPTNLVDPTGYSAGPSAYDKFSFWTHSTLSAAGAFPILGAIPDAVDLVYTLGEIPSGHSTWGDVGLASAGIAATAGPGVLDVPAAGLKIAARTARLGDEAAEVASNTAKQTSNQTANVPPAGLETRGLRPAPGTRVRPEGIPESWRVRPTKKGGGTEYFNPKNRNESVRVMQGNPKSPYPNSQAPYARQSNASGTYLRPDGTPSPLPKGGLRDGDAHIPLYQFKVR